MNCVCVARGNVFVRFRVAGLAGNPNSHIRRRSKLAFRPLTNATAAVETPGCLHAAMTLRLNSSLRRPPPRHNTCRLYRSKNPGVGDEGYTWHVMDRHSRTER